MGDPEAAARKIEKALKDGPHVAWHQSVAGKVGEICEY
jgi:hypothetical protein